MKETERKEVKTIIGEWEPLGAEGKKLADKFTTCEAHYNKLVYRANTSHNALTVYCAVPEGFKLMEKWSNDTSRIIWINDESFTTIT